MDEMIFGFLKDALFAAVAAVGFGAISRIPLKAYVWCGVIAAVGHSVRFLLLNPDMCGLHIVLATGLAAFVIGCLAVFVSPFAKTPAEAYLFPSLLPMIPGIYAYKAFGGMAMCLLGESRDSFDFYFFQFAHNAFITLGIIMAMVIGAVIPIFAFKGRAFTATR